MSVELYVFLEANKLPAVQDWQTTIRKYSLPLTLDHTLNPHTNQGFTPATYGMIETGFEFDLCQAADILTTYPHLKRTLERYDLSATFCWGDNLTECASATAAAAALAAISDGILYDPQGDKAYTGASAIAMAQRTLQEIDTILQV